MVLHHFRKLQRWQEAFAPHLAGQVLHCPELSCVKWAATVNPQNLSEFHRISVGLVEYE